MKLIKLSNRELMMAHIQENHPELARIYAIKLSRECFRKHYRLSDLHLANNRVNRKRVK